MCSSPQVLRPVNAERLYLASAVSLHGFGPCCVQVVLVFGIAMTFAHDLIVFIAESRSLFSIESWLCLLAKYAVIHAVSMLY